MSKAWTDDAWTNSDGTPSRRHGKGKRWLVRWREPQSIGPDKLRSLSFAKKSDAEAYRTRLDHEMRSGTYRAPELAAQRFQTVYQQWLDAKIWRTEQTRNNYLSQLQTHVLPFWGARRVGEIRRAEVIAWVGSLSNGTAETARHPLAASTVTSVYQRFSAIMLWAELSEAVTVTPCRAIELPRKPAKRHVYLSIPQVEQYADTMGAIRGDAYRVLTLTLAYTGLRLNEALALRSSAIVGARAHIDAAWMRVKGQPRKLGDPKGHKVRRVPLPAFLLDELRSLTPNADGFLFCDSAGETLTDEQVRAAWSIARTRLGRTERVHDLRHAAASIAIAQGADVKVVQEMLGHASATLTLDTYADLWPDRLDEVADAMTSARERALGAAGHVRQMCDAPSKRATRRAHPRRSA